MLACCFIWQCPSKCACMAIRSISLAVQEVQTTDDAQQRRVTGMTCRGIAYISNLAVAEHVRRNGIGSALLRAAEAVRLHAENGHSLLFSLVGKLRALR